jgi:hypothetical protein
MPYHLIEITECTDKTHDKVDIIDGVFNVFPEVPTEGCTYKIGQFKTEAVDKIHLKIFNEDERFLVFSTLDKRVFVWCNGCIEDEEPFLRKILKAKTIAKNLSIPKLFFNII